MRLTCSLLPWLPRGFVAYNGHFADSHNMVVNEPTPGSDPIAILMYDTLGNMSVQIMKRSRNDSIITTPTQSPNNSNAYNGYDAYFGICLIDTAKKQVTHIISGSINPKDVGKQLTRNYRLNGDTLSLPFPLSMLEFQLQEL